MEARTGSARKDNAFHKAPSCHAAFIAAVHGAAIQSAHIQDIPPKVVGVKVNRRKLVLNESDMGDAATVDVRFDGHRVWSVKVPPAVDGGVELVWPPAVRARLSGRSRVAVFDSASQKELAVQDARFGLSRKRLTITDKRGQWLAMTKWDRLGPVLEGSNDDVADRLVHSARRLADDLQRWGYPVYLVGGTLLGMVRGGQLLPHDDDIDFAFLADSDEPVDLGAISFDMERKLVDAGYTVARHSLSQIELVFFDDHGQVDHYIDIFTGFIHEGQYCQPFALRSDSVTAEDLVPTRDIDVNGVPLPAPADPEAWLAYGYGEGWRVPDPTFKFTVARGTKHRFESWFGIFNRGRFFWEKYWQGHSSAVPSTGGDKAVRWLDTRIPAHSHVLDLGCGSGTWSQALAARGHTVLGVDFSYEALRVAQSEDTHGVPYRRVNANDRTALLELGANLVDTRTQWHVLCTDMLHGLTFVNRQNIYLMLRLVLREHGTAVLTFDTHRTSAYARPDPRSWHYPLEKFEVELQDNGLVLQELRRGVRRSERGWRRYATAVVTSAGASLTTTSRWAQERDEDVA